MSRFLTPPRRALGVGILPWLVGRRGHRAGAGDARGRARKPRAQAPPRTHPLETIFEAQSELFANPGGTLDELKRLGVDRVKVFMPWNELVPDPLSHTRPRFDAASPAAYPPAGWAPYDAIIREAAARGIGMDLALEAPAPLWATAPGVPPGTSSGFLGAWEPSAKQFGLFVHAVAERYSGHYTPAGAASRCPGWISGRSGTSPTTASSSPRRRSTARPSRCPPLSTAGCSTRPGARCRRPAMVDDTVVIGEIAPRGTQPVGNQPGNFSGMVPLRFIRALYCVDGSLHPLSGTAATERSCPSTTAGSAAFPREHPGLFQAGGFGFHPYPQGFAPNVRTPDEPDYADLPQLKELQQTLDGSMAAYGSHNHFLLYDTEFGYQTNPPEATISRAVHPGQAAAWANLAEWMSWRDPRVVSWDQYLLADPQTGASSFDTGLEFYGGKHKALYDAFRLPVYLPSESGTKDHALEVWGCVRPVHFVLMRPHAPQTAQVQFKPATGGAFKTIARVPLTDPYGYFDTHVTFPGSGLVRISWSYPRRSGGGQIHSRTVRVTIR